MERCIGICLLNLAISPGLSVLIYRDAYIHQCTRTSFVQIIAGWSPRYHLNQCGLIINVGRKHEKLHWNVNKIQHFSFVKINLKMSSAAICLSLKSFCNTRHSVFLPLFFSSLYQNTLKLTLAVLHVLLKTRLVSEKFRFSLGSPRFPTSHPCVTASSLYGSSCKPWDHRGCHLCPCIIFTNRSDNGL